MRKRNGRNYWINTLQARVYKATIVEVLESREIEAAQTMPLIRGRGKGICLLIYHMIDLRSRTLESRLM